MKYQIYRFVATVLVMCTCFQNLSAIDMVKNGESLKNIDVIDIDNSDYNAILPTIICPPDVVVVVPSTACSVFVTIPLPTSDDPSCPLTTVSNSITGTADPSGIYPVSEFMIQWTITDACGASMICDQLITVEDNTPPTFTPPPAMVTLDCGEDPTDLSLTGQPTNIMDNCMIMDTLVVDNAVEGSCPTEMIITRRWQIVDESGNVGLFEQEILLTDTSPPIAVCQDITLEIPSSGMISITSADVDNGSSDDCSAGLEFALDITDFACNSALTSPVAVTMTVTDDCGNSATCVSMVTIEDNTVPAVICPGPMTGACSITEFPVYTTIQQLVDDGGTYLDNCEGTISLLSETSMGSCPETIIRVYEVTDVGGNTATCEQNITINDTQMPVINCPANQTVPADASCTAFVMVPPVAVSDNCGIASIVNDFNGGIDASDTYPLGMTTVIFTVTDLCNNSTTCSFVVHVTESEAPDITCPADLVATCDISEQLPYADIAEFLAAGGMYSDNCSPVPTSFGLLSETSNGMTCPETITRVYQASDSEGNMGTCEQLIVINDITNPVFDAGPTAIVPNSIACSDPFPTQETLTATDNCGNVTMTLDTIFNEDICNGFVVAYTWTATDDCGNSSSEFTTFSVEPDTEAPVLMCNDIMTGTDDGVCEAFIMLPDPTVSDNCSGWTAVPTFTPPLATPNVFPEGVTMVEWTVTDDCGNTSTCSHTVTVVDDEGPAIVCNPDLSVSIGGAGTAILNAATVVVSATDNCNTLGTVMIRRLEAGGGPCNIPDNDVFGPNVTFCCADATDTIMVEVVVSDGVGNTTTCMVGVTVDDVVAPTILSCVPDITLSCGYDLDTTDLSEFGTIVFDPADITDIIINDDFYAPTFVAGQDGLATDNCPDGLTVDDFVTGELVCNQGVLTRTLVVSDGNGNSTSCEQLITIIDFDPFVETDITWPIDTVFTDCTIANPDPAITGTPQFIFDECSLVAATYSDQTFTTPLSGCSLIRRTWSVIDWCQFESNVDPPVGIWTYVQDITILSLEAPQFLTGCQDTIICGNPLTCIGNVSLSATAEDECTAASALMWWYEIDIDTDGTTNITGTGSTLDHNINFGNHQVTWYVEDRCGNVNSCIFDIEVTDCKAPTPICYNGLAISLMPMNGGGMIEIWATDFNNNSYDNCTLASGLTFSFSSDVTDANKIFTCSDEGIQTIEMWVTDEHGNQAYCETYVDIQDPFEVCPDNKVFAMIAGEVMTEFNEPVEETKVSIESNDMDTFEMTEESGHYEFPSLAMYEEYYLSPIKNDDPLNGVSTLDLVLIQKHILAFELLESPYKVIAADIDNNQDISAIDLIELRKLILGIYENYPSNTSWRFVDATHEFTDVENPWPFPEQINYDDLQNDEMETNFVGVKIGDVNNTVELNINAQDDTENRSPLYLSIDEQSFEKGDLVEVQIKGQKGMSLIALQMSLTYDQNILTYEDLEAGALDLRKEQTANSPTNGVFNIAWHNVNPNYYDDYDVLFTLAFKANERGVLSQTVNMNHIGFSAEAYNESEVKMPLSLRFENPVEGFELLQNYPNPFSEETEIQFRLPKSGWTTISIFDATGKVVYTKRAFYEKGNQTLKLHADQINSTGGILFYRVDSGGFSLTKQMILID